MELPITLPADHPLRLGNFTSAHLGTFESALTASAIAFNRVSGCPSPLAVARNAAIRVSTSASHSPRRLLARVRRCQRGASAELPTSRRRGVRTLHERRQEYPYARSTRHSSNELTQPSLLPFVALFVFRASK